MVLIGLLQKKFFDNLETQKFPSHVIIVRKEDLLNIKEIEVLYKPKDPIDTKLLVFNLYTFVTDFYISSTHINLLE